MQLTSIVVGCSFCIIILDTWFISLHVDPNVDEFKCPFGNFSYQLMSMSDKELCIQKKNMPLIISDWKLEDKKRGKISLFEILKILKGKGEASLYKKRVGWGRNK